MPKICQTCGEHPATVHVTDVVNKQKRELHLCEACARQKELVPDGLGGPAGAGAVLNLDALVSLVMGRPDGETDPAALICPDCGLKYAVFRAEGRLGCPADYEAFRPALGPLLERIHRGLRHTGKSPRHEPLRREATADLAVLRAALAAAVADERYEDAGRIRDRIRQKEGADESR